jgi:hypothetical protein
MAKTVKVAWLIDRANAYFENSADSARMERLSVASFIDTVLHETGNYAGFNYLKPYGSIGADSSRVVYYKSYKLGA